MYFSLHDLICIELGLAGLMSYFFSVPEVRRYTLLWGMQKVKDSCNWRVHR